MFAELYERECTKSNRYLVMRRLFYSIDIILKSVVPSHLQKNTSCRHSQRNNVALILTLCNPECKRTVQESPSRYQKFDFPEIFVLWPGKLLQNTPCSETSCSCIYYAHSRSMRVHKRRAIAVLTHVSDVTYYIPLYVTSWTIAQLGTKIEYELTRLFFPSAYKK